MSGRCGGYVYSWRNGKLQPRRHVISRDPRTPAQLRSRAALSKASKAWNENQPLTEELRDHWDAEAAKIKCKPRLYTSGIRTAQQHFVGSNSLKERWGLPFLLEPPTAGKMKAEGRRQNTETAPESAQPQVLNPTSWDRPRACTGSLPDCRQAAKCHAGRPSALRVPTQVVHFQSLPRPASERPRPLTVPPPVHCRWQVQPEFTLAAYRYRSELRTPGRAGERDHIPDIWHSCQEHQ
jgi:hypothetical protein